MEIGVVKAMRKLSSVRFCDIYFPICMIFGARDANHASGNFGFRGGV